MSEPFVFDPRCAVCKDPFGAVAAGRRIAFHVRPLASEGFTHCALHLLYEFGGAREERELSWDGPEGERVRFSLTFSAPEPDLVWYCFRLWREDGSGCFLDRSGYRSQGELQSWQLTVYDGAERAPSWFGDGITYQIFPDRFHRLTVPDGTGLVGERVVHRDWAERPEWRPDERGEVRNRDFFGGSLAGITAKLDYLQSLSVSTLYLCPIFESASNHRYNTADYTKIDPMLGTEADFRELCRQAKLRGIRVILDGVFNHTGSQSVYFNADGFYPGPGAAQSPGSPYADWYRFHPWPDDYDAWWGIRTLPAVNENAPSYLRYIAQGPDSVVRRWMRAGASGWRLDVADELPGEFIRSVRSAVEEEAPDGLLLGEVWEDASNKTAYSQRRRYLLGGELHGVMNYPFRTAALGWLRGGDAAAFVEEMEVLRENYPPSAFYSAMNFLGTHDTTRILTELGAAAVPEEKAGRAEARLSDGERRRGAALLRVAAALLYAFPGSPTLFYGDEAGMEGFEDPFNRGTFPWGREDRELVEFFTKLGRIRRERPCMQRGTISYLFARGPLLMFSRILGDDCVIAALNAGESPWNLRLRDRAAGRDLLSGRFYQAADGALSLSVPGQSAVLLQELAGGGECFT